MKVLPESSHASATLNPIRAFVETVKVPAAQGEKKVIPLSIGDPTLFGNLKAPQALIKAVQDAAADYGSHGYKHSTGMDSAKAAVAQRHASSSGRSEITAADVFLASGCSGALDIAIRALCSAGDNILLPSPMFPLYMTIAHAVGIQVRTYPLLPEKNWEADLAVMESLIDRHTGAILVNSPSNPCGCVYSKSHLEAIIAVAERHGVPIISDEIYGNLVFKGHTHHPLASLTRTVPILEVGGIAKEYLVPGFRLGWIILYDAPAEGGQMALSKVREGVLKLTQLLVGPNVVIQAALPRILLPQVHGTPQQAQEFAAFHADTCKQLEGNSLFFAEKLAKVPGIRVVSPQGAMYVMLAVELDGVQGSKGQPYDDEAFCRELLAEELVFLLPGKCFGMKGWARAVVCAPQAVLADAARRIENFCSRKLR